MELETTDNVPVLFTRIIDDTTVRINFDGAELDGERNGDKFAVIDISVACSTVDISRNEEIVSVTLKMMRGMGKVSKAIKRRNQHLKINFQNIIIGTYWKLRYTHGYAK